MPRMTADLIDQALSRMSPIDDRELDLRGQAIPAIENLGVTQVRERIIYVYRWGDNVCVNG